MAKVGRNDPCPCGSGKKYKKCCAGKKQASSNGSTSSSTPFLNPSLIAQQWLKSKTESRGETLRLHMDHFEVAESVDLRQIRQLGKPEKDTVLFYHADEWIGEADLSLPGQLILTTAEPKAASLLRRRLEKIPGIKFLSRTEDQFQPLTEEERTRVAQDMLDFKKRFFQSWLDEPNERLKGKTPRQAVKEPPLKMELLKLLAELEKREADLPRKERYSFKSIRSALDL